MKTQHVKETETTTKTKTKEEKHEVTTTVTQTKTKTKTKTKDVKVTRTKIKTKEVKATAAPAPGVLDPSLFTLNTNVFCHLNSHRHLECFGTGRDAVKYDEVSNKKFKKCVKKNDAKCFDEHMRGPVRYFADRHDKMRGVACARKGAGAMCWGTPKHGAVDYKKVDQEKLNECMYDVGKCD